MNPTLHPVPSPVAEVVGRYRWLICGLVFIATTINYLDRTVISLLKPTLEQELHWTSGDYANIEIAFKLAYALGMLGAGRVVDKLGTKLGYALSTTLWSLSAIGHALVASTLGFGVARAALGLTEAGNFPAAIKTVAEWFPQRERALATGIFNSGANVGAVVAPLTVPFVAASLGWRWAFVLTGLLGFFWLVLWRRYYNTPAQQPRLGAAERAYIERDQAGRPADGREAPPRTSWGRLLTFRQTWAFVLGKFITDPVWWFYLFWLPDFLGKQYHLHGTQLALPVASVYVLSSVGSVSGGYLPLGFIRRGMPTFQARKKTMLLIATCVLPLVLAQYLGQLSMWLAVGVIGLAAAAHQAWSANIFTTVSDMFPKRAVASVTGLGGMAGSVGSILFSLLVQKHLFMRYEAIGQLPTAYFIIFLVCSGAYLLAWLVMFTLVPRMQPIQLDAAVGAAGQ